MKRDSSYRLADILKEICLEAGVGWTGYGDYELQTKVQDNFVTNLKLVKVATSINIAKS